MGLFDIMLKALGFESVDDKVPKEKKVKEKKEKKRIKDNIITNDDFDNNAEIDSEINVIVKNTERKVHEVSGDNKFTPVSTDDLFEIVDTMRKRETVIVDFSAMNHETAEKSLDFITGAVYVMRGEVKKLDKNTFVFTPPMK